MGTRHLIIVYYKGEYHIAQYGQWDGYPEGQGLVVLSFIREPANLTKLQAAIDNKRLYKPTEAQVEEINRKIREIEDERRDRHIAKLDSGGASSDVDDSFLADLRFSATNVVCPTLACDTSARILQLVADATEPVPIKLDIEFIADQLFCEWAYVVNLDARVLEVYSGRAGRLDQNNKPAHGRFKDIGGPDPVAIFRFDKLPEAHNFVEQCLGSLEGDDEDEKGKGHDEDQPVVEGAVAGV